MSSLSRTGSTREAEEHNGFTPATTAINTVESMVNGHQHEKQIGFKSVVQVSDDEVSASLGAEESLSGELLKALNSGPTREVKDDMLADECRHWVASVVGDAHNAGVLQEKNFVDSLRDGVILLVLLQKLNNPPVPDSELKLPRRSDGFFARDNVIKFLRLASERFNLTEAELFTDTDLCDGKNDRAVITCLLSVARTAYSNGDVETAPESIVQQKETTHRVKQMALKQQLEEQSKREVKDASMPQEQTPPTSSEGEISKGERTLSEGEEDGRSSSSFVTSATTSNRSSGKCHGGTGLITLLSCSEHSRAEVTNRSSRGGSGKGNDASHGVTRVGTAAPARPRVRIEGRPSGAMSQPQHLTLRGGAQPDGAIASELQSNAKEVAPPPAVGGAIPTRRTAPPTYRPRRWDKVDILFSVTVNAHFAHYPHSQLRFHRLSGSSGEYMVCHGPSGTKRHLCARTQLGKVLVGVQKKRNDLKNVVWTDLSQWLEKRERDHKL
uniref:Uncharacterized protein TCIL3000_11_11720 n=1 Tax=Trypanosoma congolense (strain IL3000) TaxID=1068625 RepID=G0V208_TRYCI|nr:unnamed protein product [Trypanosoma congolense IL3000]